MEELSSGLADLEYRIVDTYTEKSQSQLKQEHTCITDPRQTNVTDKDRDKFNDTWYKSQQGIHLSK